MTTYAKRIAWTILFAMLGALGSSQQASAQNNLRTFNVFITGFDDTNGNGVLDCGEPVDIEVGYADSPNDTGQPPFTGEFVSLYAGSTNLSFLPGSVAQDETLVAGSCAGTITTGNIQSDVEATLDYGCTTTPMPIQGNAIAWKFKALFVGTTPSVTATAHATTSDGVNLTLSTTKTTQFGTMCSSPPPSVTVTKSAAGSGKPGSTLLYTLTATDMSGLGLGGVQFTDVIPDNTVFDAAASDPGWLCPGNTAGNLCRLAAGNINPNATITRFFAVDIVSPLPSGVSNVANTACLRSGPSTIVGCASVSTPTSAAPVLQMTKTLASGSGTPAATLVYNLGVMNTGNQNAGLVTLKETVPANTTFVAGSSSPGWSCSGVSAGATCTLSIGSLAAGSSASATFAVQVAPTLPAGTTSIGNTACADTSGATESCSTVTTPTNGMPMLSLKKTAAGNGAPGGNETYGLSLQNTGTEGTTNVTVTETVPANTTYVASGSSAWSCSGVSAGATCTILVPSLAAGATVNLTFVVQIVNPLPAGVTSVTNTACAAANGLSNSCSTVTTPTTGNPALAVTKSYTGGPVLPGATLTFSVSVSNSGNQDAGPTTLTDTVPANSTFDAVDSSPSWSCAGVAAGSTCTINLANVAAGVAPVTFVFAVKAPHVLPPSTVIGNTACAQAGQNRACGSVSTPAALATDTLLSASIDHALPALSGDRIHYTLTIPNTGGTAFTGVVTTGALDTNTTLVVGSVMTDHGVATTGNGAGDTTVVVTIGSLPAGDTATVKFDVTVNTPIPAGLTFVAAQFSTSGTNIPTDPSDDPSTPAVDDPTETPVMSSAGPPPAQPIPTLGQWGLILLMVGLAGAGVVMQRRRCVAKLS